MRITEILQRGEPSFSFEFFPPKTDKGFASLFNTIATLELLQPGFVSVTCGAGGSTRDKTLDLVARIKKETRLEAMAHFTCVGSSQAELRDTLSRIRDSGIENVLALRGDPPKGETEFVAAADGLHHASQLVELIRHEDYPFCVGGACYPEPHPEANGDAEADLGHLQTKVDAGTDFLITQLFFDNTFYFDFVKRARALGIDRPIIPGIMPITNVAQIERFTNTIGATIPQALRDALRERQDDPDAVLQLGVAYATAQCDELLRHGAPGIHFYTLNKSPATRAILSALRILQPWNNGK